MKYINQLLHPDIPYRTNVADPNKTEEEKMRSIAKSGCGLCCACMMVDQLTSEELTLEEAVKMSEESGANYKRGTTMRLLGPALAEKFDIEYCPTSDLDEVIAALKDGGHVIALVETDPETKLGLFTNSAHYISLISTDGKEFCILDPSYKPEKFEREDRKGRVNTSHAPYLYCDVNVVHAETARNSSSKYYVFKRKR